MAKHPHNYPLNQIPSKSLTFLLLLLCFQPSRIVSQQESHYSGYSTSKPLDPIRQQRSPRFHNPLEAINVQGVALQDIERLRIQVSPGVLTQNAGWVKVSWSNAESPSDQDWVAVYVPADADPTKTAPIKYKMAKTDPGHVATGSGSVDFRLINMRADVRVAFLRGGLKSPRLAAWSNKVIFADPDQPMGVHLALTGKPGEMLVSWTTKNRGQSPNVGWRSSEEEHLREAEAETTTYTLDDMCGGAAKSVGWIAPGFFHSALISGFQAGERVAYSVGDAAGNRSATFQFMGPPEVGPHSTVQILAYGDMGQAEADGAKDPNDQEEPSLVTMSRMMADPFLSGGPKTSQKDGGSDVLVLHIGDISYARGYVCQWDSFFEMVEQLAARAPYMTLIGNHEVDWPASGSLFEGYDSGGECGVAYSRRLPMPAPKTLNPSFRVLNPLSAQFLSERPETERIGRIKLPWYSFDHGMVHLVMMSTEHDFRRGSDQYAFLAADLASVDRQRTPWIIFNGHRPMYIDSTNDDEPDGDLPVGRELKKWIEPLLKEHGVELALWGHHHSYQRTCPVYRDKCVRPDSDGTLAAPVHLVIGMGGAGTCFNIKPKAPDWIEFVNVEQHGYLRIMVNESRLLFEFVGNNEGAVLDSGVLTKRIR